MVTKHAGVFLTAILIAFSAQAQVNTGKQPLRTVLQSLEKQFNVAFTFADKSIAEVTVDPPPRGYSLANSLQVLSQQTGLNFQSLNERYIAISEPRASTNTLCGTLRSSETGEVIAGASIQLGSITTISNEAGYFELNRTDSTHVIIKSLGFEPLELSPDQFTHDCQAVLMKISYTTLEEVTVADFIATGIEKKTDGSLTVRNEFLGILPGLPQSDALQTLQYLPSVKSVAEAAADINIRGGTNDQNLVLLDGIKVYQTGHFFGLISGFNPHITEKVNLIKNGSSAYYGDGTSGTITIQAANQVSTKVSGSAGINLLYADGSLRVPITKKMSLLLAARRSLPSSWQTPTYRQYFNRAFSNTEVSTSASDSVTQNQNFYFFDTSAKLIYDLSEKDKLRATFFNVANLLAYEESAQVNGAPETKKSSLEQHSLGSSISYSRFWSDGLKTQVEGYLSNYTLDAINQDIPGKQQLIQGNKVQDVGARISALVQLNKNSYLQTGYQFFETGITNSDEIDNPYFKRLIKEVMRTHALFAEANLSAHEERTNLRIGVRTNYYAKLDKFFLEPRLVVNQKIGKYFSIEALAEMKTQASVQVIDLQNDFLGVEKRRWLLSNEKDIPLLSSRQVSTGLNFSKNKLLISTDLYYKKVAGVITSSQGFQNQFQYVRASGNYDILGLDILINHKAVKTDTWLGYTLANSLYQFPDLVPSSFPNNLDIRHSLNGGISYRYVRVEVSAGANWHSGRPTTNPVSGNEIVVGTINYSEPNSAQLKNYFRVDFSVRWHFYYGENIRSHAGISVWNVLNRVNELNQYYTINALGQAEAVQQLGLAFTPNVFVRIDF